MKLTDQIKIRELKFKPKVEILENTVELNDIGISIPIPKEFTVDDGGIFENFKKEYVFPENSEFSKKDRESFENGIFSPVFTLKKNNGRPIIACYLFDIKALKGGSNLNIRSINKFELMWAPYLAKKTNLVEMNAKRILKNELTGALSTEYGFDYKTKNGTETIPSNLRILTYEVRNFVLTFYLIYDNTNNLEQTELDSLIDGIKTNGNNGYNSLWQKAKSMFNL
ncbi:MAG: hypothetical protein NXH86_01110 [Flavobacteriaceae bacterium]|uniref:hypothetical protein n=1 Tax=Flagellimonas sp. SN16 TaxID=3415142 RepID=UPI0025ED12DE|nr:hypothetical protein [Allomuricauda sp.]MCR9262720.1 hypothetical protein [Flavobacteriaceae bacterium]